MRKTSPWTSTLKKAAAIALASVFASTICFPTMAFAKVDVDGQELSQGSNSIGGGTAMLTESTLDMEGVTANSVYTDESLDISFGGGNDIEKFTVGGDAQASMSFSGKNEVEDIYATDNAKLSVKADRHNDFEEINASGKADVLVKIYGENEFESFNGTNDSTISIVGKTCQKRDKVKLAEGESEEGITTENGNLKLDHVTIEVESEKAHIGSKNGSLTIDTSKIEGEDGNKWIEIFAGKEMLIDESVIEITGTVFSEGKMTVKHSDIDADKPASEYDVRPYRIFSKTGIELIDEENGNVEEGEWDGDKVWYVDTDDNDGDEVDLEADGEPEYYKCHSKSDSDSKMVPKMGYEDALGLIAALAAACSLLLLGFAASRRQRGAEAVSGAPTSFQEDGDSPAETAHRPHAMARKPISKRVKEPGGLHRR